MTGIKLKIAGVIIELKSRFRIFPSDGRYNWRYRNFIYRGEKKPEIILGIKITKRSSLRYGSDRVFTSIHPLSKDTNWSLFGKGNKYVIKQYVSRKRRCAVLNNDFSKGEVYLSYDKNGRAWRLEDVIYDLLQIILINYLSKKGGIFVHSVGLKDIDRSGLLFAGPAQSGKSTTARIWHEYSKADVLNDDRVAIRKMNGKFFIFGTPWYGNFRNYPESIPDNAELKSIFFIYHNPKNKINYLGPKKAFVHLYPNIFPAFWSKKTLKKQLDLCRSLVSTIPSYRLGFKKDKSVISTVRSVK